METMISIVIMVIMGAIVAESLRNSTEFNQVLSMRDATARTARTAMARIKRDLQLAYLTPNKAIIDRYQTVFVGQDDSPDSLFFSTLNHQRMYLNTRESDQAEITLWAEPAPKDISRGNVLYLRESSRIDQYPDEQGKVLPLAYNVRSFELKYLNQANNEWQDEWDTRSGDTPYYLPRAVQIGLVLIAASTEDDDDTEDVPFLTTVQIEYAPRLPQTGGGDVAAAEARNAANGSFGGTIAGQASIFDPGKFGKGGYGGGGFGGLASGLPSSNTNNKNGRNSRESRQRNVDRQRSSVPPSSPADALRQGGLPPGMIRRGR
jgi:general secretion pathway protein J